MSSTSPSSMLPAKKRSLERYILDKQFFSSRCKVRKLSSVRRFPTKCGRLAHQTKADDVVPLSVAPLRSVNPSNLNGSEIPHHHNVEESAANDIADCVGLPRETWECKPEKIRQIASQVRDLVDYIVADSTLDDKVQFKLVVEKKDSGFRINWGDGDGETIHLSRAEWDSLKLSSESNKEEADATSDEMEKEFENKCDEEMEFEPEGTEVVDFVHTDSFDRAEFDSPVDEEFEGESEYPRKIERDGSMLQFKEEDGLANFESTIIDDAMCNVNPDFVNLTMVQRNHPDAIKARETLELFEEYYTEFFHEPEKMNGKCTGQASNQAANRLKKDGNWISTIKPFGHIPGVEIGDKFRFRAELAIVGLHCQMIAGIDYVNLDGKIFATSVVNSGRYENEAKTNNVLIYSGQGGNSNVSSGNTNLDQKLEKGNLALVNSKEMQYPIRVTFKTKRMKSENAGMRNSSYDYVYDGLYIIHKYWEERGTNCKMVYKFELHRLPEQPRPHELFESSRISTKWKEVCVLDDISNGLEKAKIRVMNNIGNDKPLPFTYTTKIVYPDFFEPINPIGCDCINGCSDLCSCHCVKLNGVEIPFNEHGSIILKKPIVHECGTQCKCPPTCMNRVSQFGIKYELEIFKTMSMGWGVRSRNYISMGSFICEYVGELLQDYDTDGRKPNDEYLFDIYNDDVEKDGFVIDALHKGNIGRFFNHSCSPNLFAQEVLYDHGDTRMPHIMFFAATNIPPLKELTYDYNYQIDHVQDENGNIKMKECQCGSRECRGRMY